MSAPLLPDKGASYAERIAIQGVDFIKAMTKALKPEEALFFERNWRMWAHASQEPPTTTGWRTWLIMAGRGFGKTRAGAEWVRGIAERHHNAMIALVGATMDDVRSVMVEGPSGLLTIAPPDQRPLYEPSLKRLTWPGGAVARLFSAAEPESLRGAEHTLAWADEIAKWPEGRKTWDNMMLGLRIGDRPRAVATTTPRPVPLLKALLVDGRVAVTRGRTFDNRAHLSADFVAAMTETYGGTRLGRQELDGELIDEFDGALWSRELIEACRVRAAPKFKRVVIGVDPPAGAGAGSDACGIVVVALCERPEPTGAPRQKPVDAAYVIADASVQGLSPEGWARAVARAYDLHSADKVIAEANNGGAMVESVLRAAGAANLSIRLVHAAHGKVARAEPVAALYEAGKAFHIGVFRELEDELAGLVIGGDYCGPGRSPDRADALVWAMWELMLGPGRGEPRIRGL